MNICDTSAAPGAIWSYCSKINTSFNSADLSKAYLIGTNFSNSDLSGTILANSHFSKAQLINTNVSEANLAGADLADASLYTANFSGATWIDGVTKCNRDSYLGICYPEIGNTIVDLSSSTSGFTLASSSDSRTIT